MPPTRPWRPLATAACSWRSTWWVACALTFPKSSPLDITLPHVRGETHAAAAALPITRVHSRRFWHRRRTRGTSRSRFWQTTMATWCTCTNATAPCSADTKRRARLRAWRRRWGGACQQQALPAARAEQHAWKHCLRGDRTWSGMPPCGAQLPARPLVALHRLNPCFFCQLCNRYAMLSLQVVEMAPAPGLDQSTREALFDDAVALAKHMGYRCVAAGGPSGSGGGCQQALAEVPVEMCACGSEATAGVHLFRTIPLKVVEHTPLPLNLGFTDGWNWPTAGTPARWSSSSTSTANTFSWRSTHGGPGEGQRISVDTRVCCAAAPLSHDPEWRSSRKGVNSACLPACLPTGALPAGSPPAHWGAAPAARVPCAASRWSTR